MFKAIGRWICRVYVNLTADPYELYLSEATDLCDLENRLRRAQEQGRNNWLSY